jgi:hypothetical protein
MPINRGKMECTVVRTELFTMSAYEYCVFETGYFRNIFKVVLFQKRGSRNTRIGKAQV